MSLRAASVSSLLTTSAFQQPAWLPARYCRASFCSAHDVPEILLHSHFAWRRSLHSTASVGGQCSRFPGLQFKNRNPGRHSGAVCTLPSLLGKDSSQGTSCFSIAFFSPSHTPGPYPVSSPFSSFPGNPPSVSAACEDFCSWRRNRHPPQVI